MNSIFKMSIAVLVFGLVPAVVLAQPSRQIPGTRPMLPGSPPINGMDPNSRVRAAVSQVGNESTDFYGKKGYPRVLGDSVETSTTGGASAAGVSGQQGGNVAGGSAGNGGGSLGGQLGALGGGISGGGGGGAVGGGFTNPGITGGGFSGLVPKGFGFGGTPHFSSSWLAPLNGGPIR